MINTLFCDKIFHWKRRIHQRWVGTILTHEYYQVILKFSCFAERGGFSLKSIKKGSSQGGGFSAMGPAADVWYSPVLSVAS